MKEKPKVVDFGGVCFFPLLCVIPDRLDWLSLFVWSLITRIYLDPIQLYFMSFCYFEGLILWWSFLSLSILRSVWFSDVEWCIELWMDVWFRCFDSLVQLLLVVLAECRHLEVWFDDFDLLCTLASSSAPCNDVLLSYGSQTVSFFRRLLCFLELFVEVVFGYKYSKCLVGFEP